MMEVQGISLVSMAHIVSVQGKYLQGGCSSH